MPRLEIVETPIFSEDIDRILGPDEYRKLQLELVTSPTKGTLIKETGGARKLRFAIPGKGKSGGIRIIYYYKAEERIYLLLVYKKSKQENLTPKQCKALKALIERIK